MVDWNNDRIWSIYELGKCLATAFGGNITCLVRSWCHLKWFSIQCIFCHFLSILLFPTPPHHTLNMRKCFQILLVCFDHMHIIWKVSRCSNHSPIPSFDVVIAPFWILLLSMEIQWLCSRGKNMVCVGDYDAWFIPYGYGMDDCLVFYCVLYWFYNLGKSYLSNNSNLF